MQTNTNKLNKDPKLTKTNINSSELQNNNPNLQKKEINSKLSEIKSKSKILNKSKEEYIKNLKLKNSNELKAEMELIQNNIKGYKKEFFNKDLDIYGLLIEALSKRLDLVSNEFLMKSKSELQKKKKEYLKENKEVARELLEKLDHKEKEINQKINNLKEEKLNLDKEYKKNIEMEKKTNKERFDVYKFVDLSSKITAYPNKAYQINIQLEDLKYKLNDIAHQKTQYQNILSKI